MMMGMRGGGPFGILEFDTNGDGRLAKPEFDAAQRARFTAMDANNDGGVVPDEMRAYAEKQHQEGEAARFQILDADHNGQLSQAEFNAAREHGPGPGMGRGPGMRMRGGPGGPDGPGPGMRGRRGPGGPGGQFGPGAPPGAPQANAPRRAGPLDADSDGKITLTEFTARSAEVFDRADLNNDNVVTIAELQTLAKAQR
jgi:hypothetical protein